MKRKILSLFLINLLVAGFIIGCAQKEEPETISQREKNALTFWHWWTDRQDVLEELAKRYEDLTGQPVCFTVSAPIGSTYYEKLQAAAQANTLPDIIGLSAGGDLLARYIKAGKIVSLTDYIDLEFREQFYPGIFEPFFYGKDNIYNIETDTYWGIPLSVMNIQIFYNKDLFKKAGLSPENPPKTWDEFIETSKKLRESGIAPFAAGFGDLWMINAFLDIYAWCYLGQEGIKKTFLGKLPYTSQGWLKAMEKFEEMHVHNLFIKGIVTMPNKKAEQLFALGGVAMAMNGSWAVNVYYKMNPDLNYGIFPFPKPEDARYPFYLKGGLATAVVVTTNSKNKEEAIKFLKWLTSKEQMVYYAQAAYEIPANKEAAKTVSGPIAQFADDMDKLMPNTYVEEKPEVLEVQAKGVQSILINEATPKEVLEQATKIKEQLLSTE